MKKCTKVFSVILVAMMLASLAACGAEKVKITPTAARSIETEVYETADFSITIPKGWVVTAGGENIYPEEVIDVLLKMPEIAEAAVYGMPDPKWGEHVKASIVCKPGRSLTVEQVQTFCRANMPSFRMPREVEFLPELPKNATGKVLIQALKNR